MLRQQQTGKLVLTGQVTEQCILYSALDAYIRPFEVVVPHDADGRVPGGIGSREQQPQRGGEQEDGDEPCGKRAEVRASRGDGRNGRRPPRGNPRGGVVDHTTRMRITWTLLKVLVTVLCANTTRLYSPGGSVPCR